MNRHRSGSGLSCQLSFYCTVTVIYIALLLAFIAK